ncbi:MAG: monovalent cation/H(+) antiporter subunit G [Austwickia sp.]|jgi:multicomponent Na+:H+ antiporter subunit G|nr:MAG: monovalent cation/H(+) antiporter subunit G [Austwickia sp.]
MNLVVAGMSILGAVCVLVSALSMMRERDAYSRINVLGLATSLGLPLIVVAAYLHRVSLVGFDVVPLLKCLVTVGALWVVSSIGSMTLARSTYLAGTPVDPCTDPQDLANAPGDRPTDEEWPS